MWKSKSLSSLCLSIHSPSIPTYHVIKGCSTSLSPNSASFVCVLFGGSPAQCLSLEFGKLNFTFNQIVPLKCPSSNDDDMGMSCKWWVFLIKIIEWHQIHLNYSFGVEQGKIVAKLLLTEARLRDGRSSKVPQGQKSFKSKKKKKTHHPKIKRKKSYSGHLLTASGGR